MADVLGVAASVAGLMTIADSIVRKGFKFIKDVKEAEKSVEKLVEEVNNLSGVLHSLNNVVKRIEEDGGTADPSTRIHYIESCYQTLKKIQDHFDAAVPATRLSRGERLKWPLKKAHTKELLDEIERHKATMSLAMSARQMTTLLEILAGQDSIRDGLQGIKLGLEADRAERRKIVISEERQKMLRILGDVDARKWQDSSIRLRQPGTGIWFTDGADFKSWLSTDESKLWINGIPGAGKTILISTVIQEIEKVIEHTDALAFFYCDYKNPQTQEPLNILGALARQLIMQNERCFTQLSEFSRRHTMSDGSTRNPTSEELCGLIRNLSKHFHTTIIVIDGLDEITHSRAEVTRDLSSLNSEGGKIKTLFASRPEVDLGYELEDFVQVSIAAMSSDLRLYVASEIERRTRERRLRIRDPTLKDHIMTTLIEGADGMFRWVSCQMDYLCECNNDRDRREALNKLPPDLPSSYERILERVNRSSIENQAIVMKTLHWIVYADYDYIAGDGSLLTTEMLLQALAIRDGEEFFEQSSMASEEEVFHWCSSLVRRSNSGYLELAHFTVKEFLQTIDPVQKPHFRHYCLSGDHTILAKACLNFIQCPQFAGFSPIMMDYDGGECTSTYKFISYACEHWPYHAHNSRWDDIQGNVNRIFDMENTFMRWIQADFHMPRDQFISKYLAHPQPPSSLHWAALFGLDKFCATLLLRGMNPSQQSSMGTPLICAMLSRSVICNMVEGPIQSDRSWQPQARQSVIRHLLEAGLDLELPVDAKGQRRALTVALDLERFYGGMKRFVVSMLLDFGARVSVEDFDIIRRQLESFVEGGEIDALLEYGSGDELCGIYPWRLIDIITRQGWRALVRGTEFDFFSFVLEIASCNWPPGTFQSFFQVDFQDVLPCTNGSELTKLLRNESEHWKSKLIHVLSKAIVISAPDAGQAISRLQRSFFYAEATGNASVASLLLAFNPDLNASRRDLRTREIIRHLSPQTSTEHAKDTEINKSLSLHRARLLLPDESGISPIEYAAYGCSADIFRLYWDAAAHDEEDLSLDISIEIVEKTLKKAIESRNGPVMSLLIGKLFHSEIMPDDTLLEFAVCQEIPTFLEAILDFEKSRFPSHERTWNNLMQNERGYDDLDRTELQAFYLAAKPGGSINNFAFLLERGLPISHQYQDGITALHVLAANNDEESFCKLQALLKTSKQNLDMCTKSGMPPLAHAIISGNLKGMELLLDAGANPGVKVMEDLTSLHIACYIGNLAAVETLLRHGSQTSLNNQGSLAKYIALGRGHHEIAAAIQDTIDSTTNSAKTHPETSSSKGQLLDTPSSDFAETEDHGGLPLLPKQK